MRQSDDWSGAEPLSSDGLKQLLQSAIDNLDVDQVRSEVEPFIKQPEHLAIWSNDFFRDIVDRIAIV